MPSLQWHVEPVRVSCAPFPVVSDLCELETVANNTLVAILRQFASLVVISEKVLSDIQDECQQIMERTIGLRKRVQALNCRTQKLDAKHVKVRK
ncbi:hypothetical protein B4U80_07154 [Leptotrombidium deliense]|uniref:Uncharacterized protein n=1 Tax=Leptotrombidium deliense TaxID=299467 RepID=A0A443SLU3_9ACAR|nr:hypothetical protein B4U80_07154 [Leptotrombidium deliense]